MRTGTASEDDAAVVIDHDLDRILLRNDAEDAPVAIGDLAHDLLLGLAGAGIPERAYLLGLFDIAACDAHLVVGDECSRQFLAPVGREIFLLIRGRLEQLTM